MAWLTALIGFGAALAGVVLGSRLARRNEKSAQAERLLVEAFNDAITAMAEVAGEVGKPALTRYASATSRIALHAPPTVVSAFREFQNEPTTETAEGREQFLVAVQSARDELALGKASNDDLAVLIFGGSAPKPVHRPGELP